VSSLFLLFLNDTFSLFDVFFEGPSHQNSSIHRVTTTSAMNSLLTCSRLGLRVGNVSRSTLSIAVRGMAMGSPGKDAQTIASHPTQLPAVPISATNPVGSAYHDLVRRGSKGKPLALRDLRKLLEQCVQPSHAKYGVQAVAIYQIKGQDFSEEINSHFISAVAERGRRPLEAAHVLAKYKNRIGAWSTASSLAKLINAMTASAHGGNGEEEEEAENGTIDTVDSDDEDEEDSAEKKLTGRKARTAERRAARLAKIVVLTETHDLVVAVLETAYSKGVRVTPALLALAEPLVSHLELEAPVGAEAEEGEEGSSSNGEYQKPVDTRNARTRLAALQATIALTHPAPAAAAAESTA
jgi:hypothetical protein